MSVFTQTLLVHATRPKLSLYAIVSLAKGLSHTSEPNTTSKSIPTRSQQACATKHICQEKADVEPRKYNKYGIWFHHLCDRGRPCLEPISCRWLLKDACVLKLLVTTRMSKRCLCRAWWDCGMSRQPLFMFSILITLSQWFWLKIQSIRAFKTALSVSGFEVGFTAPTTKLQGPSHIHKAGTCGGTSATCSDYRSVFLQQWIIILHGLHGSGRKWAKAMVRNREKP